jgi:hypothetical protein
MTWFIRNIRDVQWYDAGRFGVYGDFEQGEHFPEFGFNFGVVWPGQPVAMYHREDHQEGFLVLSGECRTVDPVTLKHGAGVEQETTIPAEAYGPYPEAEPTQFREEFLP